LQVVKPLVAAMLAGLAASTSLAAPRSPFGVQVSLKPGAPEPVLRVNFALPPDCVLYAERLHFQTYAGDEITPSLLPAPVMEIDKATGKQKLVYEHSFQAELSVASLRSSTLVVKFQGCTNAECYFPEKRIFNRGPGGAFAEAPSETPETSAVPEEPAANWAHEVHDFRVTAQQSGYLPPQKFLGFLDRAATGDDSADDPLARFKRSGLTMTLLLIVLGGALLNLTPCILPMIPINLAIIGAGSAATSRLAGFRKGAVYGLGMALAYGVLGLGVVLTGAKFGTLNSSVWFNVVIALIFGVLALGMFDVLNVDLSRFGGGVGPRNPQGRGWLVQYAAIFVMGAMAALLAGACVAPVVISVMLLAADIYARGNVAGLLLPFLLGTGMALPWPLAGAGLSFMPKPGKWMMRVKHGFGVLILGFAFYYGYLAHEAAGARRDSTSLAAAPAGTAAKVKNNPNVELAKALREGREQGKPVFIDFHATWCKNCAAMDETVFNRTEVKRRMQDFVMVRYDAERPGQSPAREVLDHFGVMGLPAYVILKSNQ
jgi:thiol:disulfide interchange protein